MLDAVEGEALDDIPIVTVVDDTPAGAVEAADAVAGDEVTVVGLLLGDWVVVLKTRGEVDGEEDTIPAEVLETELVMP